VSRLRMSEAIPLLTLQVFLVFKIATLRFTLIGQLETISFQRMGKRCHVKARLKLDTLILFHSKLGSSIGRSLI